MSEIPEHLRQLRQAAAQRQAAASVPTDAALTDPNHCGLIDPHDPHPWWGTSIIKRMCPGTRLIAMPGRVIDGVTFTAGGPRTNSDPAGVLHIPRSLLAAAQATGSIDDLVRLIETNVKWDANGPVIPPRIIVDDDTDAAVMAARAEADEREFEARYELSVARLDHWASTFRNCRDDHRFTDDELDQLSHLLTWAANQINQPAAEPPPEPGLEDIIDAMIDAVATAADRARSILDRVAERLAEPR